ncbi:unnamed protein product, partial [Rhizoctonia solani]
RSLDTTNSMYSVQVTYRRPVIPFENSNASKLELRHSSIHMVVNAVLKFPTLTLGLFFLPPPGFLEFPAKCLLTSFHRHLLGTRLLSLLPLASLFLFVPLPHCLEFCLTLFFGGLSFPLTLL